MIPIKLAILWHQHQPYYFAEGKFRLPWVRLHATKDYVEMVRHVEQHPKIHATINLVPSLVEQLEAYSHGAHDELLQIARKNIEHLSDDERRYVKDNCFLANEQKMIARSLRQNELHEKKKRNEEFSDEELRDIIVLYHLAWSGEFLRRDLFVASLINQGTHFTEEQKAQLLDVHQIEIGNVVALHKRLSDNKQLEVSTSPFYHPILPLLCASDAAREAMHDVTLPSGTFASPDDASRQISTGRIFMHERIGSEIRGMWPSEGSISDEALRLMAVDGITWTASDESVLMNSLLHHDNAGSNMHYGELEKYFPRRFPKDGAEITVFFRDHLLSDKIGFDYQNWDSHDAACDFVNHVKYIRTAIIDRFGEEELRKACFTVILDGENCWEYYPENGYQFLDTLYRELEADDEIQTVTFSEALEEIGKEKIRTLDHVVAGSWINSNFKIWIGHPEKNRAWELLAQAAETLYNFHDIAVMGYADARKALLRAEGSDWFWWYGDDHVSHQRHIFDELFRFHLMEVYRNLSLVIPDELHHSLLAEDGYAVSEFSAMHRAGG